MDERIADKLVEATHRVRTFAAFALCMLGLFLIVLTVAQIKSLRYIGSGINPTNTLNVSGEGEVFAVPDNAEFSFTVMNTAPDVASAQAAASKTEGAVVDYLKSQGIAEANIKTTDYSINPQYEYGTVACGGGYCPPGKQTLTGYQVSETVSVKVQDTTKAGTILAGVGSKGVSDVSGLSLTVSNEEVLQNQARDKAIANAKSKAEELARSLGVSLVRIVSYNENGNYPVYYAKGAAGMAMDSAAAPAPQLPTGQNKITSNITITYEIQ